MPLEQPSATEKASATSCLTSNSNPSPRNAFRCMMRPMKTITLEEHFLTPEIFEATGSSRQSGDSHEYMQALRDKLFDLGAGRIADMDAAGISTQVLSPAAAGLELLDAATAAALSEDVNDRLADAVKTHPTRFGGSRLWRSRIRKAPPWNSSAVFAGSVSKGRS